MAVTRDDVLHVAALARLGMTEARAETFTAQLNTILGHMDVLSRVDVKKLEPVDVVAAEGTPLREDKGPSVPLQGKLEAFAPVVRDGFFLVPRLATHESSDES